MTPACCSEAAAGMAQGQFLCGKEARLIFSLPKDRGLLHNKMSSG